MSCTIFALSRTLNFLRVARHRRKTPGGVWQKFSKIRRDTRPRRNECQKPRTKLLNIIILSVKSFSLYSAEKCTAAAFRVDIFIFLIFVLRIRFISLCIVYIHIYIYIYTFFSYSMTPFYILLARFSGGKTPAKGKILNKRTRMRELSKMRRYTYPLLLWNTLPLSSWSKRRAAGKGGWEKNRINKTRTIWEPPPHVLLSSLKFSPVFLRLKKCMETLSCQNVFADV